MRLRTQILVTAPLAATASLAALTMAPQTALAAGVGAQIAQDTVACVSWTVNGTGYVDRWQACGGLYETQAVGTAGTTAKHALISAKLESCATGSPCGTILFDQNSNLPASAVQVSALKDQVKFSALLPGGCRVNVTATTGGVPAGAPSPVLTPPGFGSTGGGAGVGANVSYDINGAKGAVCGTAVPASAGGYVLSGYGLAALYTN